MQTVTTIGLDIAKSVFQVHGVDAGGQVVIRRQLPVATGSLGNERGRAKTASGSISGWFSLSLGAPWRVGAEESGAA